MKPAGLRTELEYRVAQLRRRVLLAAIDALDAIAERLNVWATRLAVALLEAEHPAVTPPPAPVRVVPHTMGIYVEAPTRRRALEQFLHADLELPREVES